MELYLAIFLFALSAGITPGPNNIMLMSSGMNFGIKRSLPHVANFAMALLLVASVIPVMHELAQQYLLSTPA